MWTASPQLAARCIRFNANTGVFTLLHTFTGGSDGGEPYSGVVRDSAGNLYGTTEIGGSEEAGCPSGCGTIFKIDSAGAFTTLHTFNEQGRYVYGGLLLDGSGNLFGTVEMGGRYGWGAMFRLASTGRSAIVYSFDSPSGSMPNAAPVRDNAGNLYGTASYGGANDSWHGISLQLKSHTATVLHDFSGEDGQFPQFPLVRDAAGNLYGVTAIGGDLTCVSWPGNGCGTVFKIDASGNFSVLHSFTGPEGAIPRGKLALDESGNLYGTADAGPTGNGVIFKITP